MIRISPLRSAGSGGSHRRSRRVVASFAALSLGLAACGEPDPEEALEEASAELARAREVLTEAEGDVDGIRAKMRELEEKPRAKREGERHVVPGRP